MYLNPDEPEQLELPFDPPARPVPPVDEDETGTVIDEDEDDDDDEDFEDEEDDEEDEDDLPVEEPSDEPKATESSLMQ
jgi:hypothetical protein